MYGLINKAIKEFVLTGHSPEVWEQIKTKANVEEEEFISMASYDDKMTYDLVGAASETLQVPAKDVLIAFGEYWTLFTAEQGYSEILKYAGDNLLGFLQNLDMMHLRVSNIMPNIEAPSFKCENITDNSVELHYFSKRPGLQYLVVGLLVGLGKRFNTPVDVKILHEKEKEDDHDVFFIKW